MIRDRNGKQTISSYLVTVAIHRQVRVEARSREQAERKARETCGMHRHVEIVDVEED